MYHNHIVPEYFELNEEQQDFTQRFLFLDYLEEWEVARFRKLNKGITLYRQMEADMWMHKADEEYETVQLYMDVLDRFKKDMIDFE